MVAAPLSSGRIPSNGTWRQANIAHAANRATNTTTAPDPPNSILSGYCVLTCWQPYLLALVGACMVLEVLHKLATPRLNYLAIATIAGPSASTQQKSCMSACGCLAGARRLTVALTESDGCWWCTACA